MEGYVFFSTFAGTNLPNQAFMKISYNWLQEYIDTDLSPEKLGEILTNIGLEVEVMESF